LAAICRAFGSRATAPAIAVLPFANLNGDPGQQYFSDGVTEDIIDRLSKYRILSVIGNRSTYASHSTRRITAISATS
jgi:TolB-like protein